MSRALQFRSAQLQASKGISLKWDDQVLDLLVLKVDFDGDYPLEGAKQVDTVADRYLARALRKCQAAKDLIRAAAAAETRAAP
ncbi:uncharacterized protein HaLaN_11866 [Haematococcus lacustris]|uniref:Uncharacterized protein n=1 Tax=Haematococcus lacustris TaxID=44745 RepID=A0A699ZIT7_HAELA|nr:uncharacterized protein HaLaN_11866 [Haematococcus lacustris]